MNAFHFVITNKFGHHRDCRCPSIYQHQQLWYMYWPSSPGYFVFNATGLMKTSSGYTNIHLLKLHIYLLYTLNYTYTCTCIKKILMAWPLAIWMTLDKLWYLMFQNTENTRILSPQLTHCGLVTPIWYLRSWSTLFEVIACCLTEPSPYLNQCCLSPMEYCGIHLTTI